MHCSTLAELAAVLAQNSPQIIYQAPRWKAERLSDYWVAFRSRLDLWHHAMARNRQIHESGDWIGLQRWWDEHLLILEEILVTDILTRTVAALASAIDRRLQSKDGSDEDLTPITHAIHLNHMEARQRVQRLMLDNRGCRVSDAVRLNRLRSATECWTDTWLGRMAIRQPELVQYAFVPDRAGQYASEFRDLGSVSDGAPPESHQVPAGRRVVDRLMRASMADALKRQIHPKAGLPDANRRVAKSVLGLMPSILFDSWGTPKSLKTCRIELDNTDGDADMTSASARDFLPHDAISSDGKGTFGDSTDIDNPPDNNHLERWYLA